MSLAKNRSDKNSLPTQSVIFSIANTVTSGCTVIAVFGLGFTLSVDLAGKGSGTVISVPAGIDCGKDCDELYIDSTSVTLTVVPDR